MSEIEEEKYVEMPFQNVEFMGFTQTQMTNMIQAYRENGQDQLIEKLGAKDKRIADLEATLLKARTFIEYARHKLDPGKSTIGDQFPRQEDADILIEALKSPAGLSDGLLLRDH